MKKSKEKKAAPVSEGDPRITKGDSGAAHRKAPGKKKLKFPWKAVLSVFLVTLFVAAIVTVTILSRNGAMLSIGKTVRSGAFPLTFADEIRSVCVSDRTLFALSGTNLSVFDLNGNQKNDFKLSFSSPKLRSSDSFVLVYDSSGNGFSVFDKNGLLRTQKSKEEYQIVCGEVGEKGDHIVVTRPNNTGQFSSSLTYYDPSGKEIFTWNCKDYIVSARIAPNSETIAVAAVNTELIDIYTNIYIIPVDDFSLGNDDNLGTQRFNSAFLEMSFFTNRELEVTFRDQRVTYKVDDYEKTAVVSSFSGSPVMLSSDPDGNTGVIFDSGEKQTLTVYDRDGDELLTKRIKFRVRDMVVSGRKVFLLAPNKLYLLNSKGEFKKLDEYDTVQKGLAIFRGEVYNYSSNVLNRY